MSVIIDHIGYHLKQIYLERSVGQLFFQHGDVSKYLFFQNGELVHARSNRTQELLGYILFNLGKISGRDYARLNEFIEPKKNIGQVMIENGLITQEDLSNGLAYQMREIAMNIFPLFDGKFNFQEKDPLSMDDVEISIGILDIIEDGIRRIPHIPELKSIFEKKVLILKDKKLLNRLTADEKEVFLAVEEANSIESVRLSSIFKSDEYWKHLYQLYCLGLIDLQPEAPVEGKEKEPEPVDAGKEDKRIKDVLKLSEQLAVLNYYEILKVPRDTSPPEIKKAYFKMARDYHPDIFGRDLPEDVKKKIDNVFDFINKGYQILSHEAHREEYDKSLSLPKVTTKKEVIKNAEVKFRKGKTLFDQTRYKEAMVLLEEAVRMDPNNSSYFLLLALIQTKLKIYREQAVKNFKTAIEMSPWTVDGYLGLGILYKIEGMSVLAAKQFRKALEIDEDNKAALKELSKIDPKSQKKSLKDVLSMGFSSIFTKRK